MELENEMNFLKKENKSWNFKLLINLENGYINAINLQHLLKCIFLAIKPLKDTK